MNDPLTTGMTTNDLGQPVGLPLSVSLPRPAPQRRPMQGRYCRVEPLALPHVDDLYNAFREDSEDRIWTYLPNGPFHDPGAFRSWAEGAITSEDPLFHAILVDGEALGHASYLRIDPPNGAIEVGFINLSPRLQRTAAATEYQYLMMRRVFDELGYRRYEWKCDALNAPSRRAAARLGFTYEGTFRQATHYKGRNRDTAWFSILDSEWPAQKARFERWLEPANFDEHGRQRQPLNP